MTNLDRSALRGSSRYLRLFVLTLGVLLLAAVVTVSPIHADTTITVTTNADELNSDGDCSLREAIQAAYNNGGALHLSNSTFQNNNAESYGDAILGDGTTNISNSTFSGNSAGQGGSMSGVYATIVNNCHF